MAAADTESADGNGRGGQPTVLPSHRGIILYTVRDVVSFHNAWPLFDTDGWLREDIGADVAAKTMLDRLAWWARALRAAREDEPYAA